MAATGAYVLAFKRAMTKILPIAIGCRKALIKRGMRPSTRVPIEALSKFYLQSRVAWPILWEITLVLAALRLNQKTGPRSDH